MKVESFIVNFPGNEHRGYFEFGPDFEFENEEEMSSFRKGLEEFITNNYCDAVVLPIVNGALFLK